MKMFRRKSKVVNEDGIRIVLKPEEIPEFERVYTITVGDGFKIEVGLITYSFSERCDHATVTQKDGRSISFDAHKVADKIIDRDLYPLVQGAVDRILALDKGFIDSKPSEFIDEKGTRWRRVE